MKNYDPNITRGVHTVRITLQMWEYKGHIIRHVCGKFIRMKILVWQ